MIYIEAPSLSSMAGLYSNTAPIVVIAMSSFSGESYSTEMEPLIKKLLAGFNLLSRFTKGLLGKGNKLTGDQLLTTYQLTSTFC